MPPQQRVFLTHTKRVHLKIKEHFCDECWSSFSSGQYLSKHRRRVHLKEKDAMCDECKATFFDKKDLKAHVTSVQGDKNITCEFCPYKSSRMCHMKMHVRAKHAMDKNHVCKDCGSAFLSLSLLTKHHDSAHLNIKKHKCD